jgi:hypothetical protein
MSRRAASVTIVETLGDDLVLLSIRPNGVIVTATKLQYGLSGSELVRLAALRRVDIERGRIVVLNEAATGDVLLNEALASMSAGRQPPTARAWVARHRGPLVRRYLDRLAAAGTIQLARRKALGFIPVDGWTILDAGRMAAARARLDAIAHGTGDLGMPEFALAGLATAIGLPLLIYRGRDGSAARRRIADAARGSRSAAEMSKAVSAAADGAPDAATRAAADAASRAAADAVRAAADAAVRAATDAAVQASIDAATQAAISAATEAAHHAANSAAHDASGGGGHAGGHH